VVGCPRGPQGSRRNHTGSGRFFFWHGCDRGWSWFLLPLVSEVGGGLLSRHLIPALGLYGKLPVSRIQRPVRHAKDHRWRTSSSSAGRETTGSNEPNMGHDGQLLATRPCPPANDGGSGQVSARMVSGFSLYGTNILMCFVQLHATYCDPSFTHFGSAATGRERKRYNQ